MNSILPFVDNPASFAALINIVEEAGKCIMQIYDTDYKISIKEDNSPVTTADEASHKILMEKLGTIHPIPILSEEGNSTWTERRQWKDFWLVDPLDGTKDFIRKNGQFTINIAIIHQHQPIFGMLYKPATSKLYYAAKGRGSFKRINNGWQELSVQTEHPHGYVVICSHLNGNPKTESFLSKLKIEKRVTSGSALKFAHIAEGSAQLYPRFGPTSLWDVAAGQCIVEEAGGEVVDKNLRPLNYNHREETINPAFIVCAQVEDEWSRAWQQS